MRTGVELRALGADLSAHHRPAGSGGLPSDSQAKFDNGVLMLTLAKKVPAGATQLNIA